MDWNKMYITPSSDTSDEEIKDFIEWVSRKAERLGLKVELERYIKGSGSLDTVSVDSLEENNETQTNNENIEQLKHWEIVKLKTNELKHWQH